MARILVVDDDQFILSAHSRNLERLGHEVLTAVEGREAVRTLLDAASGTAIDLVLLDYMLPQMDGLASFTAFREVLGEDCPPVIMVTAQGSTHLAVEFMKAGGTDFVEKPVTDYAILDIKIQRAVAGFRADRERREESVARKAAEASDRLKEEFLSLVALKLRDPLRGVMRTASRLSTQAAAGQCAASEDAEKLTADIADVTHVVDEMLDLAELDSLTPIVLMPTDLGDVLRAVEPGFRAAAEAKGLGVVWEVAPGLPQVLANQAKLGEVVRKLLDNALKFTDAGSVSLRVESDERDVLLTLRDTGPGIPQADQGRIFKRFSKLDPASPIPGVGIGLYIAKRICERMNATLRLESAPGKGTVLFLSLPVSS